MKTRWRRAALAVGACFAAAGCSGSMGSAADSRLVAVHNTLAALGLSQVGHITEGSLADGNSTSVTLPLEAQCYTFVAFAGGGGRSVQLSVGDASNPSAPALASSNPPHDQQATVQFCPAARGSYAVTVRMLAGGGTYALSSWQGSVRGGGAGGSNLAGGDGEAGTCGNPTVIQIGQTVQGNTQHGRSNHTGSCLSESDAPEVVYQLQVERKMLLNIAAEEDFDGALYVRHQNCEDNGSEVSGGCNDDDNDTQHSRVVIEAEPGTYYLFMDGYSSEVHGAYSLTVTGTDIPTPQEVCQNAPVLTPSQAVSGQTTGDPSIFQASCGGHATGPDKVYRLEVPQESRVQIFQETDYDGVLHLRSACADQSREVACNDDAGDEQHARINAILAPGTYYVFTDGYNRNASGNFNLEADLAPVAGGGVPGDSCQDAQPLTPGTAVEGNTLLARDDVASPCAAPQDGYDVVYRLDIANRSRVHLWLEGADVEQNAVIYLTRSCAAGAANANVECRAGATGEDNALEATLERGQYYVVVDSAQARAFGRFKLHSRVEDLTAIERACRTATVLRGRGTQTVTGTTAGDDRFQSSCAGNSRSPENLYRLVLRRRSFVRVAVEATSRHDPSVYIRSDCGNARTERACMGGQDPQHALVETTLDPGTYTVFVDGYSTRNFGSYSMQVTVNPQP